MGRAVVCFSRAVARHKCMWLDVDHVAAGRAI